MFSLRKMSAFTLFILTAILLTACGSSKKLGVIPPMEEVEAMTYFIADHLQCDQDQIHKIREVVKQNLEVKGRIYQHYRGRQLEMQERHKERMDRFDHQIEALLNDTQRVKYHKELRRAIRNREFTINRDQQQEQFLRPGDQGTGSGGYGY